MVLLKWLINYKLSANHEDKWLIEDFRKLALLLAKNHRQAQVIEFFESAVEKFGVNKVSDFMEI